MVLIMTVGMYATFVNLIRFTENPDWYNLFGIIISAGGLGLALRYYKQTVEKINDLQE